MLQHLTPALPYCQLAMHSPAMLPRRKALPHAAPPAAPPAASFPCWCPSALRVVVGCRWARLPPLARDLLAGRLPPDGDGAHAVSIQRAATRLLQEAEAARAEAARQRGEGAKADAAAAAATAAEREAQQQLGEAQRQLGEAQRRLEMQEERECVGQAGRQRLMVSARGGSFAGHAPFPAVVPLACRNHCPSSCSRQQLRVTALPRHAARRRSWMGC